MTKLKGIAFPSFREQQTAPSRQQWVSHTGKRQKVKYLRMVCRPVLKSTDTRTKEILAKINELTAGPFQEYGTLMIIHQALEIAGSVNDSSFVDTLDFILEKLVLDQIEAKRKAEEKPELEITVEEPDATQADIEHT